LKPFLPALAAYVLIAVTSARTSSDTVFSVHGKVQLSRSADASGAVVWLMPNGDSRNPQPRTGSRRPQLLQKNKTFTPHVLVIPVGAPVEFPNQDPFFHNVFSLFEGKRFDLGLYEAGTTRTVMFDRPGISYIFCNIHPEMSAVVLTLKTPYYGISDRNGTVVIPDVPPGTYELRAWHERAAQEALDDSKQRVTVSETSKSFAVVRLSEQPHYSPAHKNKYGKDYDTPAPNSPAYTVRP
jgi:plastocyanin